MCTINFEEHQDKDPLLFLPDFTKLNWVQRVSFQLERGDKSNLLHWQVFIENLYPVGIKKMGTDIKAQGKWITICKPKDDGMHRCRGRNYVKKGKEIDGHRYIWCRSTGWENKHSPIIPVSIPEKSFAMDTRKDAIDCMKLLIRDCSNYVKKCSTMKII